ncbi:MAG: hypothetical protein FWF76_06445 [Oscillospiraceae bacterium]|nr:hypothetical protein [Oscillospiraceae bacterium]
MKKTIKIIAFIFTIAIFLTACANNGTNNNEVNQFTDNETEHNNSTENTTASEIRGGGIAELIDSVEALEIFAEGIEADVYDIETGITYRVRRVTGGYNTLADVETMTIEDTEKLLKTTGGDWCVRRRAVIVTVGDRRIAASIAPFPHSGSEEHPFGAIIDNRSGATGTGINLDSIRGNGMIGVIDIFFLHSLTPGINRVDARHQEMVLRAYEYEG